MATKVLEAEIRTETGKNANNRLRENNMIPAVVYSHGESEKIQVSQKAFRTLFKGRISESVLVDLNIKDKESYPVFVKDFQLNPVTDEVQHLDFYKVTAGEKIKTTVELKFVGQSIGVKRGGNFEVIDHKLDVEVLPKDLVEAINIDISNLKVGQGVHVSEIETPESMTFLIDPKHVVAHVLKGRGVVEEETAEAAEGEESAAAAE